MTRKLAGMRKALRMGAMLAVAAIALPLMATAAGAHTDEAEGHGGLGFIIGRWDTTVLANGKPPSEVVLVFRLDHKIDMYGPTGANGKPVYVGTGSWRRTSPTRFDFDVTHPLPDANGVLLGTIRGHQEGTVSSRKFTTSGAAFLDKVDGTTVGPNPVSMNGVRARH